ncbi:MAG TPA: Rne/Rng family ribonuclease [Bacteroidales bacterium]|nr:Rne/Rng family ribonuclease [Bacteroidales bacterium]HPS26319.1 Rne/Rng family ribonuclease [Bacteroidales bacterium]
MNRELIIDSGPSEVLIALLENKKLVELHREKNSNTFSVGDIYLGKVKRIVQGLNAAFIDIGYEKDAFLHYLDLGPQIHSLMKYTKGAVQEKALPLTSNEILFDKNIEKSGKISQIIAVNQEIPVQIAKEPISNKGPRITSELAIAGRYLVLVPFSDRISISQKIKSSEDRNRLKRLVTSIKPKNFGVIIRTVAENKKVAELIADLEDLMQKWESLVARMGNAKAPKKILSEIDRSSVILRDILNETFNSIHVNDTAIFDELRNYIKTIAPEKADIVKYYKGKDPIFEHFGIDKQIRNAFGKKVYLKNGAYLIIEHTEAMHVIDVNSGHRSNTDNNQESNAMEVNMDAAGEIARQLRLRDMGGIISIDFIDLHIATNRRMLFEKMRLEMESDHAKHTVLPPSKFGVVQITRQRVRPETNVKILEQCPFCEGSGEIRASISLIDDIENRIQYLLKEQNERKIKLLVHPYFHAYLTKGVYSRHLQWFFKYKQWIKLGYSNNFHFLEYHFFNSAGEEIKL